MCSRVSDVQDLSDLDWEQEKCYAADIGCINFHYSTVQSLR